MKKNKPVSSAGTVPAVLPPIAAVSTPLGRGAISVVRMSGKGCIEIAKRMFTPFPYKNNELIAGTLEANGFKDSAMCVYFKAPRSYTGEDMAEFHTHGGFIIAQAVMDACIMNGCRAAENGEFTKRAYLNGKLNLTEAEGIIDIIDADSKRAANNGYNMLTGGLDGKILKMQERLTDILAGAEAALDYPEEDLELPAKAQIKAGAEEVLREAGKLLETVKTGRLVKNGIEVVIAGDTNVGKSSLLNGLLGFERAIVTETAGTTRDTLSQSIMYKDVKFNLTDTAGMRETADSVEKIGVERAKDAVKNADIILLVADASKQAMAEPRGDEIFSVVPLSKDPRTICVFNKTDLNAAFKKPCAGVEVSALTGYNLETLKEEIYRKTRIERIDSKDVLLTNSRHIDCLNRAVRALKRATENLDETTLDCAAAELTESWKALGEITGKNTVEEIITRIFEKFCIGK